ncbi:aspartate kinase [Candidatus Sumerlaeota bacterium]|nr:aspartate kinase [Candidatus Sumerlaeota bacterium]
MKVAKFGGTSLAASEQFRKVIEIVRSDPDRRILVVSAPGKRAKDDIKVTDLLIALAKTFLAGKDCEKDLKAVVDRYREIQEALEIPKDVVDEIEADLRGRFEFDASDAGRFTDAMKAAGEDNCARLMAEAMRGAGMDAHYVSPRDAGLLLTNEFGNARVLPESFDNLREALSGAPGVSVFPGFFGYTPDGHIATFPRGGSDITGAIVAAAVRADLYENFTDVDSVFSADPSAVDNPRPISELTYQEMRELAYAGFGVFHDEAVAPAVHAQIPICIKSTHRPDAPGTRIVPSRRHVAGDAVGIASTGGFCSIFIEKYMMNREVGFGRRVLEILENEGISYEHVPSGIDNMSVVVSREDMPAEVEKRVVARIREELEPDDVGVEHGLALVMIVGEGMRHTVGVAARATAALARGSVNIEMINQGSSEISMMFGVKEKDCAASVRALYGEFFK